MSARNLLIALSVFVALIPDAEAITCYECTSGQGQDCKYSGTTCSYGLFGCMKMTMYSGGVDKLGNFYNEESKIVSMARGCTFLPIGGVDACQQTVFAGYRLVTCYCFSDYCNSSKGWDRSYVLLLAALCLSSFVGRILL
uniref:Protein quiver n=1 Tax=Steinernema glaseri TaxID=37863 RepID=A0A1I7ZB47_9BILA